MQSERDGAFGEHAGGNSTSGNWQKMSMMSEEKNLSPLRYLSKNLEACIGSIIVIIDE